MITVVQRVKSRIECHGKPEDVQNVCLDDIRICVFSPSLNIEIIKCPKLAYLTLNQCRITSLYGFPHLEELACLELQKNLIKSSDLIYLKQCPQLSHLSLDMNIIETTEQFQNLKQLQNLEHIEVKGNPICAIQNYRGAIFDLIGQLEIIDCEDRYGNIDALYETQDQTQENLELVNFQFNDQDIDSSDQSNSEEDEEKKQKIGSFAKIPEDEDNQSGLKPRKYRRI